MLGQPLRTTPVGVETTMVYAFDHGRLVTPELQPQNLTEVVSAVFDLMETYEDRWTEVEGAEDVPLFGFPHGVGLEPVQVNVGY